MSISENRFYEFGEFRLDSLKRTLQKDGEFIPLKGKAFDLLLFFVKSRGEILTHDQILDRVWEGTFVEQANLKKNISTLRKVLGEQADESNYIQTLPKRGYRFVSDVRIPDEENHISFGSKSNFPDESQAVDFSDEANKTIHQTPLNISESPENRVVYQSQSSSGYKRIFQIGITVLLITVGLTGIWLWRNWRKSLADDLKLEKVKLQKLQTNSNVQTTGISPDGKTIVYAVTEEGEKQSLWMRRIGTPNTLQLVPAADVEYRAVVISPDNNFVYYGITVGRTDDYLYQVPILGGIPRKITEGIHSPASFSPDGKRIAFVRDNDKGRTLYTVNTDGNDEREVFSTPDSHNLISPRFSPNGKNFAFVMGEATPNGRLWSLSEMPAIGGKITNITPPQKNKIFDFARLVDDSGFIICAESPDSKQKQIYRVTYPNGEISKLTNDFLDYDEVSISDDGKSILALQSERDAYLWAADTTNLNNGVRLNSIQNSAGEFTLFPNGQILYDALENGQRSLMIANADGNNARSFTAQSNAERDPFISPDKKSITFLSRQSGTEEVWQADLNGGNLHQLTSEKTFLSFPKLAPDGKSIYFQRFDDTAWHLIRMSLEDKKPVIVLDEAIENYDFSPDGTLIAYSFYNKDKKKWQVAVRNLADNSLQKQFDIAASTMLKWTPDGKGLIYNVSDVWLEGGNIWLQPIDGSQPKLYLDAGPQKIYTANFSADGKKLFYMRGMTTSNMVLIKLD